MACIRRGLFSREYGMLHAVPRVASSADLRSTHKESSRQKAQLIVYCEQR